MMKIITKNEAKAQNLLSRKGVWYVMGKSE